MIDLNFLSQESRPGTPVIYQALKIDNMLLLTVVNGDY